MPIVHHPNPIEPIGSQGLRPGLQDRLLGLRFLVRPIYHHDSSTMPPSFSRHSLSSSRRLELTGAGPAPVHWSIEPPAAGRVASFRVAKIEFDVITDIA